MANPNSPHQSQWPTTTDPITQILNCSLANSGSNQMHDIHIFNNRIAHISPHYDPDPDSEPAASPSSYHPSTLTAHGALLVPSLCNPHMHLDKAYLLSQPRYAVDARISQGTFSEALESTQAAKKRFTRADLRERGQRVLDESRAAGVTHMRGFFEVDGTVGLICAEAGLELKRAEEGKERGEGMILQVCAFAQEPLFTASGQEDAAEWVVKAAELDGVDVLGSTPYVEATPENEKRNVEWMVETTAARGLHLDFHLDYHLDESQEPLVWFVLETLKAKNWVQRTKHLHRTVVLGHCTRLTHFTATDWHRLRAEVADLPVSFVGLPTSDLYMMRDPENRRGTLDVVDLIRTYDFNACLGINNVGNAFTPQGCCDPLALASAGVGLYQAGTERDAEVLFQCVSTRARAAIGLPFRPVDEETTVSAEDGEEDGRCGLRVKKGDELDLVIFGEEDGSWRTRKSVAEAVYLYDLARGRRRIFPGTCTGQTTPLLPKIASVVAPAMSFNEDVNDRAEALGIN